LQARELAQAQEEHVQLLRAETRDLSLLEERLRLARAALPWFRQLPFEIKACMQCQTANRGGSSAGICRIVLGHEQGLSEDDIILVKNLSASFQENERKAADQRRIEMLSEDPDVNVLLQNESLQAMPLDISE